MRSFSKATLSVATATALALVGFVPTATADDAATTIALQDRCDPATFDAVLGAGACNPNHEGRVTFAELGAALADDPAGVLAERDAEGWRFHSSDTSLRAGQQLVATNTGGEVHTFTQVPAFAGGCVPPLNAFFKFDINPLCPADRDLRPLLVFPGSSLRVSNLTAGKTYRFQCLIHPWMRTTVRVG